jgi:hypothetical protein
MKRSFLFLLILMVFPLLPASGQDEGEIGEQEAARRTRDNVDAAVATDQAAQQQVEAWAAERTGLQARHRQLEQDMAFLERRLERERTTTAALEAKVAEFERRLVESERLTESLEDTLSVLVERLETAVTADLPFLAGERSGRLALLDRELGNPDSSAAEKLRRVLEAYQVEAGYGGTVEMVVSTLDVAGEEVRADVLRLGRLALFWATPDRSRVGLFDPAAGAWTELDRGAHRAVLQAMDMAARTRPVEVIGLPLGRIEP